MYCVVLLLVKWFGWDGLISKQIVVCGGSDGVSGYLFITLLRLAREAC